MNRVGIILFLTAAFIACQGCTKGADFPPAVSPRVLVQTPASPASGEVAISFQLIDRERELGAVVLEYSTDNGQTFNTAALVDPAEAANLLSDWHPGVTHSIRWDSVADGLAISGQVSVCVKITPSDASNPSGAPGVSGQFTLDNIAYNQLPVAGASTPAGVQLGNIPIDYTLTDVESDACSVEVLFSTNDGTTWQAATKVAVGEGVTGLSSSPGGTAHMFLWDSRADNVAPSAQLDTVKVKVTPTDFHVGTAGETASFSVDNSLTNNAPTVSITDGPLNGSTVKATQVTFTWSGSDTDGSVIGYFYSFDHDPADSWTTGTSVTSGALAEAAHTFRVVAVDDQYDISNVASRSFTVSLGTITAGFSAAPTSGDSPLTVYFTDESVATHGVDTWSWDFGDGFTSTSRDPVHTYFSEGAFTVSLTVTGMDGTDGETKAGYISVTSPTIYVHGSSGNDSSNGLTWATAVRSIKVGLSKASSGWTVLVADGTYSGTNNREIDFFGKAVRLKSVGGADNCIIDCGFSTYALYFGNGETQASIVEGFTIRNGYVSGASGGSIFCINSSPKIVKCKIINSHADDYGGGIVCDNASPIIDNCLMENNTSGRSGAGFYCANNSNPTITNCTFQNNTAGDRGGAIGCNTNCSPTITKCTITGNTAANLAGGIQLELNCSPTIEDCVITYNTATVIAGGGILCFGSCNPSITNCVIQDNTAQADGGGIECVDNCSPVITNCLIADNEATTGVGGGIVLDGSTSTITNCTITENMAVVGGGLYCANVSSDPSLSNTIIWGNATPGNGHQIYAFDAGTTVLLDYCDYANGIDDVEGSGTVIEVTGCITLDPRFVSTSPPDYRLQSISPCVDAGDDDFVLPGVTTDIEGCVRIFDGDGDTTATVDIGAYEYGSSPPPASYAASAFDTSATIDDNNEKVIVENDIAKLAPEGDEFGDILDATRWSEVVGSDLWSTGAGKNGASIAESGGRLNWTFGTGFPWGVGQKRSLAYRDCDIVAVFSPTDATATSWGVVRFYLWRSLDNCVRLSYTAQSAASQQVIAEKIINGANVTIGATGNLGSRSYMELRIKRVASTNSFIFYYRTSSSGAWTQVASGVVSDVAFLPVNCDLYPVLFCEENLKTDFDPSCDRYYQYTEGGTPAQSFWDDSPEIYVLDNTGVDWAFDAGAGREWQITDADCVKSEPDTSTVLFKVGYSDTGNMGDVTWVDATWQTISEVAANAAAGNYDGHRYLHVQAQFNSDGTERPTLTSFSVYGVRALP